MKSVTKPEAPAGSRPQGSGLGLPSRIAPGQHPRVREGHEASGPQTISSSSERPQRPGAGLCSLRLHARTRDKGRLASRASAVEQRGLTTPVVSVHEGRAQPVGSRGGPACEMVAVHGRRWPRSLRDSESRTTPIYRRKRDTPRRLSYKTRPVRPL